MRKREEKWLEDLTFKNQGKVFDLAHLDSLPNYNFIIYTDGSVPSLLAVKAPASLPVAHHMALTGAMA